MRFKPPSTLSVVNAATVAITLVSFLFLLDASGTQTRLSRDSSSPKVGIRLQAQQNRWSTHDKTLILAVRRGCHFCEESMPFYRRLANLEGSHHLRAHLIAELPDDDTSARFLLKTQDLPVEAVSDVKLTDLAVDGTPTLILVDRSGTVQHVWSGKLSSGQETALLRAIQQ